jgi:hypothetical protein
LWCWIKSSFVDLDGWKNGWFWFVWSEFLRGDYLHALEEKLNGYYPETKVFTREGKSYLSKYPLFSNWVWLLYTVLFPCLIVFSVITKGYSEISEMQSIEANQIIDFVCYLVIATSSILYIYRLHKSSIQNITNRCTGLITRWRS